MPNSKSQRWLSEDRTLIIVSDRLLHVARNMRAFVESEFARERLSVDRRTTFESVHALVREASHRISVADPMQDDRTRLELLESAAILINDAGRRLDGAFRSLEYARSPEPALGSLSLEATSNAEYALAAIASIREEFEVREAADAIEALDAARRDQEFNQQAQKVELSSELSDDERAALESTLVTLGALMNEIAALSSRSVAEGAVPRPVVDELFMLAQEARGEAAGFLQPIPAEGSMPSFEVVRAAANGSFRMVDRLISLIEPVREQQRLSMAEYLNLRRKIIGAVEAHGIAASRLRERREAQSEASATRERVRAELQEIIPSQQVAPAYFEIRDDTLRLAPHPFDVEGPSGVRVESARKQLLRTARRLYEDKGLDNYGYRFKPVLGDIVELLDAKVDAVQLGLATRMFRRLVQATIDESGDARPSPNDVQLLELGDQLEGFLRQFPDWRAYNEHVAGFDVTEDDSRRIVEATRAIIQELKDAGSAVDPAVPQALAFFPKAIEEGEGQESKAAAVGAVESQKNLLATVSTTVLEGGKDFLKDETKTALGRLAGRVSSILIQALSRTPVEAWIVRAAEFFNNLF